MTALVCHPFGIVRISNCGSYKFSFTDKIGVLIAIAQCAGDTLSLPFPFDRGSLVG